MADPNKWLGLMKWSMKYQDGTNPSPSRPMPKEDRDFLDRVLNEAIIDENERIRQILRILDGEHPDVVFGTKEEDKQETKVSEEELDEYKEALLDELLTRIDHIDYAQNFVKMHGLATMIKLIEENTRATTRALAAEVCSVVVQNNPFCQKAAIEVGLLEVLCSLAEKDEDVSCQTKALLAISCLVRNFQLAEEKFLSAPCNGLKLVQKYLGSNNLRLQRKCLFFLRYLVRNSVSTAERVRQEGFYVAQLAAFIPSEDVDLCESCLDGLEEFYNLGEAFAIECRKPETALISKLSERIQRIETLRGTEQNEHVQEIFVRAQKLKEMLLQDPPRVEVCTENRLLLVQN